MKHIPEILSGIIITALYFVSIMVLSKLSPYYPVNPYMKATAIAAIIYLLGMSFFLAIMAAWVIEQNIEKRGRDIKDAFKEFKK